ncbi:hypothetical protein ABT143_22210 [Streptomyces sp. NPDC002033]|uniref:hypothetical protein n=1 Tax=unclassified Streptomyces TaxID=2593676 RepID=UPI003331A8CC
MSWRWCLFALVPLAVVAAIGAGRLAEDRPGRLGARSDVLAVLAVLLGCGGIVAISGAVPYFTNQGFILPPIALVLLVGFVWRQTRSAGVLVAPSGVTSRAPLGSALATALAGIGVYVVMAAMGYPYYY